MLISTDVLSEGLNLQDATRMINYDLHWNPVRLMQRIGRVDRRLNPDVEARLVANHPEQKELRGKVVYWNFLPPGELDDLLRLYGKVAHKTLRISKTFGIEGQKLLTPEDEYEALKNFNHKYEALPRRLRPFTSNTRTCSCKIPTLPASLRLSPAAFSAARSTRRRERGLFSSVSHCRPPIIRRRRTTRASFRGPKKPAGPPGICTIYRRNRLSRSRRKSLTNLLLARDSSIVCSR